MIEVFNEVMKLDQTLISLFYKHNLGLLVGILRAILYSVASMEMHLKTHLSLTLTAILPSKFWDVNTANGKIRLKWQGMMRRFFLQPLRWFFSNDHIVRPPQQTAAPSRSLNGMRSAIADASILLLSGSRGASWNWTLKISDKTTKIHWFFTPWLEHLSSSILTLRN